MYTDLVKSYVVVIIIVIIEKRQEDKYIWMHIYNTLDIKDSLFFSSLVWAILNKKKLNKE